MPFSFQPYAVEAGAKLWVINLHPDGIPNQPRPHPNDPPLPPLKELVDFHVGALNCERNPAQFRCALMPDEEYDDLCKAKGFTDEQRANNPMRLRADLVSAAAFAAMQAAHKTGKANATMEMLK
jgi:hypothetical protein